MEDIKAQIKQLYSRTDEEGRHKINDELRDLQTSLDTDWDIVVRLGSGWLQMALVKIGNDLHIFELLTESDTPLSLEDLAEKTSADAGLLGHLLRAKAAFGLIKETGKDTFTANRLTKTLSNPNVSGAIDHGFDILGLVTYHLPSHLSTHSYKPLTSNTDLPFQKAFNTSLTPFDWLKQHPSHLKSLGHAMAIQRTGNWIDSYPIAKDVASFSPAHDSSSSTTTTLLVDIGGGFGQQALAFREKFPQLKGRIIVQDIAETLDRAPSAAAAGMQDIEFQVHDFFDVQSVKGAKYYYLRHVLHDWSDEDCVKILEALVPALGPQSRVVVDEVVLPDVGMSWQAAYMDLMMMAALGGAERTRAEYEGLLDRAGLRILDVKRYDAKMQSVILAVLK